MIGFLKTHSSPWLVFIGLWILGLELWVSAVLGSWVLGSCVWIEFINVVIIEFRLMFSFTYIQWSQNTRVFFSFHEFTVDYDYFCSSLLLQFVVKTRIRHVRVMPRRESARWHLATWTWHVGSHAVNANKHILPLVIYDSLDCYSFYLVAHTPLASPLNDWCQQGRTGTSPPICQKQNWPGGTTSSSQLLASMSWFFY